VFKTLRDEHLAQILEIELGMVQQRALMAAGTNRCAAPPCLPDMRSVDPRSSRPQQLGHDQPWSLESRSSNPACLLLALKASARRCLQLAIRPAAAERQQGWDTSLHAATRRKSRPK
jgi:hypothetical protein